MPYPQIVEYNEAIQHPATAFTDPELQRGKVKETNLGLPLALSGGFALTYMVTAPSRRLAVRCFHREIPSAEMKYDAISRKVKGLGSTYFVDFDFQRAGIKVGAKPYPIVRMDWVDGDTLGVFLDQNASNPTILRRTREQFQALATFLESIGIAHGDIQNGNLMISGGKLRLIDYDGMYVPGLPTGNGSETGHRHFQHPNRGSTDYGPQMDRFSFIVVDLSLHAMILNSSLHKKYREGGETIIFKANDFADPQNSEVFRVLMGMPTLRPQVENFARICEANLSDTPTLADFLAGRHIPLRRAVVPAPPPGKQPSPRTIGYMPAFDVVDASDFAAAERQIGNKVELIGQIVDIKVAYARRRGGRGGRYMFINFGPWRGKCVKLNIWSDGLARMTDVPDESWIGRWVSVTGLVDPPYHSAKYNYTHLSITVSDGGQIQVINETEARYRLASIRSSPARHIVDAIAKHFPTIGAPAGSASSVGSRNVDILHRIKRGQVPATPSGSRQTRPTASQPPASFPSRSQTTTSGVPGCLWVVVGFIILWFLVNKC